MTDPRQAMQMALEALVIADFTSAFGFMKGRQAIDALRAALSAQQEPVARVVAMDSTPSVRLEWASVEAAHNAKPGPLYTHPAPTVQPLADEQIAPMVKAAMGQDGGVWDRFFLFARAIERAHGIGGTHG